MATATVSGQPKSAGEVRQAFKALGYTVSLRSNPFKRDLVGMTVSGQGLNRFQISSATVMGSEAYERHKTMFELASSLRGQMVRTQKIC